MTNMTRSIGSIPSTGSPRSRRSRLGAFGLAGLVSVGLLLGASPAEAGHGHHGNHGNPHWKHGHGEYRRSYRPVFVVPSYIPAPRVVEYQPYVVQRAWYRPHNHRHVVYRFPVYTDFGVVYRPYTYCGDHIFSPDHDVHGRIAFGGPNFGVAIGF